MPCPEPPSTIFISSPTHSNDAFNCSMHTQLLTPPSPSKPLPRSPQRSTHYELPLHLRKWKQRRNILGVIFVVTFLIFLVIALVVGALVRQSDDPEDSGKKVGTVKKISDAVVHTPCGFIQGSSEDGSYAFKGIPYAQAPVGSLRWVPAQPLSPPDCWGPTTDTWNAEEFSDVCYQYSDAQHKWIGSEDCLFLNVWTPQLNPKTKLPVMVYFHSGGLMTGSGHDPGFIPSASFVKANNVVFVSFNYRLNVFGFLALEILSWMSGDGISGNYGLTDQIQALEWVQENIASFGGDPDLVTVFGSESGATSIYALLASEQAKGLFQRAWLASPAPKLEESTLLAQAQLQNEAYYNATGCAQWNSPKASVDCLHRLSSQHLGSLLDWEAWSNPHFRDLPIPMESSTILITTHGHAMREYPIAAWKKGEFNDVPLLIGSMAQEVDVDPVPVGMDSWDWNRYQLYVTEKLSLFRSVDMVPQALTHYGYQVSPEYQITTMISDIRYIQPLNAVCQVVGNKSSSPVFRYVSTFCPPTPRANQTDRRNYAFTGMDMLAFFGSASNFTDSPESVSSYVSTIQRVVFAFARTGRALNWGTFPSSTIVLSNQADDPKTCSAKSLGYFYKIAEFDFWRLHGLFPDFAAMN